MAKFLRIVFSDNTVWDVPAEVIKQDFCSYLGPNDDIGDSPIVDAALMEWASCEMTWDEVKEQAIQRPSLTPDVNYANEWANHKALMTIEEAE